MKKVEVSSIVFYIIRGKDNMCSSTQENVRERVSDVNEEDLKSEKDGILAQHFSQGSHCTSFRAELEKIRSV